MEIPLFSLQCPQQCQSSFPMAMAFAGRFAPPSRARSWRRTGDVSKSVSSPMKTKTRAPVRCLQRYRRSRPCWQGGRRNLIARQSGGYADGTRAGDDGTRAVRGPDARGDVSSFDAVSSGRWAGPPLHSRNALSDDCLASAERQAVPSSTPR